MAKSKIEWCNYTWNPTVGCSKVSDGCEHCYAIIQAARLQGMGKRGYEGVVTTPEQTKKGVKLNWTGRVNLVPEALEIPLKIKKPTMFFVDSMSDLFHEKVPFEFIYKVYEMILRTSIKGHIFQILTKRPDRALEFYKKFESSMPRGEYCGGSMIEFGENQDSFCGLDEWPLKNLWLGVSVEDQEQADKRIPILLRIPAAIRFVSYEPALDVIQWKREWSKLNQIISGGESGHNALPSHPDCHREAQKFCKEHNIAYFFKQWGEWLPNGQENSYVLGKVMNACYKLIYDNPPSKIYWHKTGKSHSGHLLDGKQYREFPKT